MARIAYVEEATASPQVAELCAEIKRRRGGKLANSFRLMAHRPRLLEPFFELLTEIRRPTGEKLTNGLKELIHFRIAAHHHCAYCLSHSVHLAQSFRRTPDELQAVLTGKVREFAPHEQVALAFADAVVHNQVDAAMVRDLRQHFDDGEVVELVMTIGVFALLTFFNHSLQTDLDAEPAPRELATNAPAPLQLG